MFPLSIGGKYRAEEVEEIEDGRGNKEYMTERIESFEEIRAWKRSAALVDEIYRITNMLPWIDQQGLGRELRRTSVSVPSNIAEGKHRSTGRDFCHFLNIAYASSRELECQLRLAISVHERFQVSFTNCLLEILDIQGMISLFRENLKKHF